MPPSPPWGPTVGCTQYCRKLPLSFYLKLLLSYFGASCLSRDFSTSRAPRGQQQEEVRPTSLSTTSPVPAARAERRRKRRSGRLRSICHMLACLEGLASSAHLQRTTTRTASLLVRVTTSLHGTSCHFTSWCELPLRETWLVKPISREKENIAFQAGKNLEILVHNQCSNDIRCLSLHHSSPQTGPS